MPRNVTVTFKDGTSHVYENVPDDATPQQVEKRAIADSKGKLVVSLDGGTKPPPPTSSAGMPTVDMGPEGVSGAQLVGGGIADSVKSAADTALNLGTGVLATPLAGLAGMAQGVKNLISDDGTNMSAADRVAQVQQAATWAPRSEAGKKTAAVIAAPIQYVAGKADEAGQAVTDATGSPLAGTVVNTAMQAVPAVLAPEVRGAFGAVARGATGAVRRAAGTAAAPAVAGDVAATAAAAAKAKAYAGTIGLDWGGLSDAVKQKLTDVAAAGTDLSSLDAQAVAREAKLQSLPVPVPATRGQLTRNEAQLRNEGQVSATEAGQPLKDIHQAQNQALLDNLDVLKGKVSGTGATAATATTPEQAGAAVQGAARAKLKFQQDKVRQLYKAADEADETAVNVTTRPLAELIQKTPDLQHLGWVETWLKKANIVTDETGTDTAGMRLKAPIRELEDLRQAAVKRAMNGGTDAAYAGDVIKAIDSATEGAGGKLYQAARKARRDQALEFEDQGAVADLVDNTSRTDRATALENTVKTINAGSLEDVRNIKRALLTGGDATTRTAGRQAMREIRAQVIQTIKDDATKGVATNVDGSPNLTPAALKRSIDKLGPDKLNEIFGAGTAKNVYRILDAATDTKTLPPSRVTGSSTVGNTLAFLEQMRGYPGISVVADTAVGLAKKVKGAKDLGKAGRDAAAATKTPLTDALDKATTKSKRAIAASQVKQAATVSDLYNQRNSR